MKKLLLITWTLISINSLSQTIISGLISNNTTWTVNNSPYIISGNTVLMSGFELEIQNGVEVLFDGNYSINIYGRLICNGTENNNIKFSRSSNYTNNWDKITLNNSDSSVLKYCVFEYANKGLEVFNVRSGNSQYTSHHPRIYNSKFKDCIRGIYVDGNRDGYCEISHNIFVNNQIGVDVDFGEPLISYNRFINSTNNAIYSDSPTCGGGNFCNNNSPQIIGNNFLDNFCDVIIIDDNKAVINENTFDISFENMNQYNFSSGWNCIQMSGIAQPTLQGNNFMDSILFLDLSVNAITATGNYFNVQNSTVNNLVNDFFDNSNLGFFQNSSPLSTPNTNAPISTLNNLNMSKCGNTYSLSWDYPTESDFQKIYITDTLNNILGSTNTNNFTFNINPPFQIISVDADYPNNYSNYSIAIEPNQIYNNQSDVFNTDLINACDSYTWIDGVTYTSSNNTATYTLINAAGCDSVVTLDLTINYSSSETDIQTACDSYTWIDGVTYTSSNNTATHTLTNAAGCDSVVTLDLTINPVIATIVQNGNDIEASAINGTSPYFYDWSTGENTAIITPSANGLYWVVVTDSDSCFSDSATFDVTFVSGTGVKNWNNSMLIFPNPTNENITISIDNFNGNIQTEVYDLIGNKLQTSNETTISLRDYSKGIYILKVAYGDKVNEVKVMKD